MTRVVIDATAADRSGGGVRTYVRELVAALPGAGIEPVVACGVDDLAAWPGAAEVRRIGPASRARRLAWEQYGPLRTAPELLHSTHYTMPALRRGPTVVTIHDLTFFTRPEGHDRAKVLLFSRAIRWAAAHADALVCVSEFTAAELRRVVRVRAPIVVAPHGVDLTQFRPAPEAADRDAAVRARLGVPNRYVLHLGTIEPRKKVDDLVAATAGLGVALVLGGRSWPGCEPRSAPHVHRLGFVADEDVAPLMRGAAVVAYPSAEEGFGLPVIEALACGVPVVTRAGTAMAEAAGGAASLIGLDAGIAELRSTLETVLGADVGSPQQRVERASLFTWSRCAELHAQAYATASG